MRRWRSLSPGGLWWEQQLQRGGTPLPLPTISVRPNLSFTHSCSLFVSHSLSLTLSLMLIISLVFSNTHSPSLTIYLHTKPFESHLCLCMVSLEHTTEGSAAHWGGGIPSPGKPPHWLSGILLIYQSRDQSRSVFASSVMSCSLQNQNHSCEARMSWHWRNDLRKSPVSVPQPFKRVWYHTYREIIGRFVMAFVGAHLPLLSMCYIWFVCVFVHVCVLNRPSMLSCQS